MIAIINGPNLNLQGLRQPEIYGNESFDSFITRLRQENPEVPIEYVQSNSEGAIIDAIQQLGLREDTDGIILNAGGYSHYSIAIADAVRSIDVPVVEVHISNIFAREEYRHTSVIAPACIGSIAGFGLRGYEMALEFLAYDEE